MFDAVRFGYLPVGACFEIAVVTNGIFALIRPFRIKNNVSRNGIRRNHFRSREIVAYVPTDEIVTRPYGLLEYADMTVGVFYFIEGVTVRIRFRGNAGTAETAFTGIVSNGIIDDFDFRNDFQSYVKPCALINYRDGIRTGFGNFGFIIGGYHAFCDFDVIDHAAVSVVHEKRERRPIYLALSEHVSVSGSVVIRCGSIRIELQGILALIFVCTTDYNGGNKRDRNDEEY